jgi:7-cyano-7-deazaguanine synthase in queuosine biosynthesis
MGAGATISRQADEVTGGEVAVAYARLERAARKPSLLSCPWTWEHDYAPCGQCDACMLRAAVAEIDEVRRRQSVG